MYYVRLPEFRVVFQLYIDCFSVIWILLFSCRAINSISPEIFEPFYSRSNSARASIMHLLSTLKPQTMSALFTVLSDFFSQMISSDQLLSFCLSLGNNSSWAMIDNGITIMLMLSAFYMIGKNFFFQKQVEDWKDSFRNNS